MRYSTSLLLLIFGLLALVSSATAYDTLSHKLERQGLNAGQVVKLNTRNAPELIGKRGIVMDTCRQLQGQAMILQGADKRSYELPDGIYESDQGIRIHVRMGGIDRISLSPKMVR